MVGTMPATYYQIVHDNLILSRGDSPAECIIGLDNIAVEIYTTGNTKRVKLHCSFWKDKEHELGGQWSDEFSNKEILNDCHHKILQLCGYDIQRVLR